MSAPSTIAGHDPFAILNRIIVVGLLSVLGALSPRASVGQRIVAEPGENSTNTEISQDRDRFDIRGGRQVEDNLFHSFERFGLDREQIANFLSDPNIRNILARVVGGEISIIEGQIQVTGSDANLYLMNPAGIIFGEDASLDVPAAFTATTATGIQFGSDWFSATGTNFYEALVGDPIGFAFTSSEDGVIVNTAELEAATDMSLLGGTVITTGELIAPSDIVVASVSNGDLIRISQPGNLLSLEIDPIALENDQPNFWTLPTLSLPELLTGGSIPSVTVVELNESGQVVLSGSDTVLADGNATTVVSGTIDASNFGFDQSGGAIQILGDQISVIDATIRAAGFLDGGTVLIGMDSLNPDRFPAVTPDISGDTLINTQGLTGSEGRIEPFIVDFVDSLFDPLTGDEFNRIFRNVTKGAFNYSTLGWDGENSAVAVDVDNSNNANINNSSNTSVNANPLTISPDLVIDPQIASPEDLSDPAQPSIDPTETIEPTTDPITQPLNVPIDEDNNEDNNGDDEDEDDNAENEPDTDESKAFSLDSLPHFPLHKAENKFVDPFIPH